MSGQSYTAEVTPTGRMPVTWITGPMSGRDLIEKLLDLGFHQQDVVDALAFADPDFVAKLNRGEFNSEP